MFKFVTLYRRVDDETVLEQFFQGTHLRLGEQLPGLRKVEVARVLGKPGGQSRFHMAVTLGFDSAEAWQLALMSDVGAQLMPALRRWDDAGLLTWYYADAKEEERDIDPDASDT